jgi:hypothetical protein
MGSLGAYLGLRFYTETNPFNAIYLIFILSLTNETVAVFRGVLESCNTVIVSLIFHYLYKIFRLVRPSPDMIYV